MHPDTAVAKQNFNLNPFIYGKMFNINANEHRGKIMGAIACYNCTKIQAGKMSEDEMKTECMRCRDVLKYELAQTVLGLDHVYLSAKNRNNKGPKHKFTVTQEHDIKYRYLREQQMKKAGKIKHAISVRGLASELADKYDMEVSPALVHKIINNKDL